MPLPTHSDLHVSRPLTNISVAYTQGAENFVATRIAPAVRVQHQYDSVYTYDRTWWMRTEAQIRGPGAVAPRADYQVSTTAYRCNVWAIGKPIPDQTRANADPNFDLDSDATRFVTLQNLIRREKQFVAAAFTTSVWTGGTSADPTPSPKWDDAAGTPIEDITAQIVSIHEKTGYLPNKLVLGPEAWDKVRNHPDVVERIKYNAGPTSPAIASKQAFAQLVGVDEVVVPGVTENTAVEGATGSYAFVYGKTALLIHAAPNPGLLIPSGMYMFGWTGYTGAGGDGQRIRRYYDDAAASWIVESEMAYDFQVLGADLGCFFQAVVS